MYKSCFSVWNMESMKTWQFRENIIMAKKWSYNAPKISFSFRSVFQNVRSAPENIFSHAAKPVCKSIFLEEVLIQGYLLRELEFTGMIRFLLFFQNIQQIDLRCLVFSLNFPFHRFLMKRTSRKFSIVGPLCGHLFYV